MSSNQSAEVLELKKRAEKLMSELPPVLKTNDLTNFCKFLVPTLIIPRDELREKLHKGLATGGNAKENTQPQLKDLKQYKTWGDASSAIHRAFQECLDASYSTDNIDDGRGVGRKRAFPAETPWEEASRELVNGESLWQGEGEVLRLVSCRKCGRVVLQQRFDAHWDECEHFEYCQGEKSPVNGGTAASMGLKVKLSKQATKMGVPAKFGPIVNKGQGIGVARGTGRELKKARRGDLPAAGDAVMEDAFNVVEIEVITCDGCGLSPITGRRYSCNECDDFDLCEGCYTRGLPPEAHSPAHTFCLVAIPVVTPSTAPPDPSAVQPPSDPSKPKPP
eukprot:CAMPEP_0181288178 /NCGR_PEP_ID=MMETSP1101-20121128/189_1 /TAXON_ID=46948 /ORGANISM="Rhodomonas abbreviata, Strain Caron Lab Isolate" /LENGTH=333 /DNA_ID=CAMNT_0023392273 /DNA_START=458 /DNA_END=1456 /DNA_ORIENTATION=+